MDKPKVVVPLLIVAAIASVLLLVKKQPDPVDDRLVVPVRVQRISAEPPTQTLIISGTTQSADTAMLRFQVSGRVVDKKISLGERIERGAVLATLYNPELEPLMLQAKENLQRVEAEAEQADREYQRISRLYEQQAVTKQEWERIKTQRTASKRAVAGAKAGLARAEQVSDELKLVAPFSGVVTEILIDVGEVVSAGTPAIRVSNPSKVELSLPVNDKTVDQLSVGQSVELKPSLTPLAEPVEGVISEISPFREQGALPEVKIAVSDDSLRPGVAVTAELNIAGVSGLSVPLRSVLMTGESTVGVYRVSDNKAELVAIRPLSIGTENVVIDEGIVAGDRVITEGVAQLFDGVEINIINVEKDEAEATLSELSEATLQPEPSAPEQPTDDVETEQEGAL